MNVEEKTFKDVNVLTNGVENPQKVVILLHGRGGDGKDMIDLARHFYSDENKYVAPTAKDNEWYPKSFLAPIEQNQPFLDRSLSLLDLLVKKYFGNVGYTNLHIVGFSQGACLSVEYVKRNPKRYGGVFCLSGGLIGKNVKKTSGDLDNTPIFLGCSDMDRYIPVQRVKESSTIMKEMNADVEQRIYEGMGHTVNQDEIDYLKKTLT